MESSSITNTLFEQLNFRGEKQKVISSNLANINTPNYKTKDLVFENELNAATNIISLKQTSSKHMNSIGSVSNSNAQKLIDVTGLQEQNDGNNVNLDTQMSEMSKNKVLFDAVNTAHADLGGKNQVFEFSLERINSKLTQYNVLSEEISGADLTKVAMEAKALELTYTALYSTISKTNQLSLVNFLN